MADNDKRLLELPDINYSDDLYFITEKSGSVTSKIQADKVKLKVDTSLATAGKAADAKATGDAINAEAAARQQAISSEVSDRNSAISAAIGTEVTNRNAAIAVETENRQAAYQDLDNRKADAIVETASGVIASFDDGGDNLPMKSLLININPVQSGTGDPSPDNLRAISGHSAVNIGKCGKNLMPSTLTVKADLQGSGQNRTVRTWENGNITSAIVKVKPNAKYTVSGTYNSTDHFVRIGVFSDYPVSGSVSTQYFAVSEGNTQTITMGANDNYLLVWLTGNSTADASGMQIEEGQTATDYVAYNGTSLTISLGQTVYSGVLDVVSGVLKITSQKLKFSDLNWAYISSLGLFDAALTNTYKDNSQNCVCDTYKFIGSYVGIEENQMGYLYTRSIGVKDSTYGTDANAFIQARGNVEFTAELRTPIEVQLTPTEVKSLLGDNNVWSDSGTVEVEYRADTTLAYNKLRDAIISLGANI